MKVKIPVTLLCLIFLVTGWLLGIIYSLLAARYQLAPYVTLVLFLLVIGSAVMSTARRKQRITRASQAVESQPASSSQEMPEPEPEPVALWAKWDNEKRIRFCYITAHALRGYSAQETARYLVNLAEQKHIIKTVEVSQIEKDRSAARKIGLLR